MSKANSALRPLPSLPLERRFSYRFSMIARALSQHMLLHLERECGLNLAEHRILSVLGDRKSPSIKDIAAHTQLDKAHVTRALTDLIGRGLVTQIVDEQDRRLRVVKLTRPGQSMLAATLPISIERQQRLERRLTASELQILWKALAALTDESARMLSEAERRGTRRQRGAKPVGKRNP